jgi:hypothetical protein
MSKESEMGPSLQTVTVMYDWANFALIFSLVVGVVATVVIVWAGGRKEEYLDRELAQSKERTAQLELARVQLEAKFAPRRLTQEQQNALTKMLAPLEKQRGPLIASPSTPESEVFVRVLGAPLIAAGWSITILPGAPTATILFPTGVVVQYPIEAKPPRAIEALVRFLNDAEIPASAVPGPITAPNTIQITVSTKQ